MSTVSPVPLCCYDVARELFSIHDACGSPEAPVPVSLVVPRPDAVRPLPVPLCAAVCSPALASGVGVWRGHELASRLISAAALIASTSSLTRLARALGFSDKCYRCGGSGHKQRDCRARCVLRALSNCLSRFLCSRSRERSRSKDRSSTRKCVIPNAACHFS